MKTMVRLFLAGIFFYIVGTNNQCLALSNSDQIHKLFLKNIELDKKIFEKLTFKLSDFQPLFSGQNVKFILQGSDGRLWFFKNGGSFLQTNNLYNWFLLCGENRPICYNIVLPINGETVKGIVQEFIPYSKNLDNISVAKLSKKQIEFIQRQQIINWFICSEEAFNCDPGQFLVQKNKIISVEKGNPFSTNHLSESLIDNFNDPLYARDNYYNVFWKAYINNEIEVDFKKSFELIDYIQNLDDRFIEEIFRFSMPAEVSVSLIIERKNRLRNEFEKYYHYLANQRGSILEAPVFQTNANFFERVFVKLKKDIRKKQVILKGLEKKNVPQANIDVVLSTDVRKVIKKFDFPYSYYQDNVVNMEKELNRLKKTTDNSNKKIALYLFLLQLKCIEQGITEENFFEFSPWLAYDPNTIDVEMIEANLRVTSNSQKGFYIDTIEEFTKSDTETIAHILYILTTCFTFGDLQAVVNRYPDNNKYSKDIRQVLDILNIESLDRNSLPRVIERINETSDRWVWKNFLLGFFYYQKAFWHNEKSVKQKAIAALKKVVHLSKDKRLLYVSYLFLGYLYEHNKNCIRFGRGFSLNAAINAYKKAIEINPDSIPAHLNLYTLFFLKVEPKKAWYHLMRIKKINPQYARENFCFKEGFYSKIVKFKKSKQVELLRKCSLNEEQRHILDLIFSVKYNRDFVNKNFK